MEQIECDTFWVKIYIAGDYEMAKQVCREYVMKGLCINISKVDYIYTMGEEAGICVELIRYPRFKESQVSIVSDGISLGKKLMENLCQGSYTIMTPRITIYFSRREEIRDRNRTEERLTI